MVVHSALPERLEAVVDEVLGAAGVAHVAHGDRDTIAAADSAAGDEDAGALIGPFMSRAVAEAGSEATAAGPLPSSSPSRPDYRPQLDGLQPGPVMAGLQLALGTPPARSPGAGAPRLVPVPVPYSP